MADQRFVPRAPAPTSTAAPGPVRPDYTGGTPSAGFESATHRRRRLLRTRPSEPLLQRLARQALSLFGSDDYPRQLAAAAAGAQAPVTTGRRIVVTGSRGGSGKTTTAALLARIYGAMRQEPAAALDLDPGLGTLALRCGAPDAPSLEDIAQRMRTGEAVTRETLMSVLGAADNGLWISGSRASQPSVSGPTLSGIMTSISRYFPVTVLDCPNGVLAGGSAWAVSRAHAVVFVAPATVAGLEDLRWYRQMWETNQDLAGVPLLAVLTGVDGRGPFDPAKEAAGLSRDGIAAIHLPYDRHLAAGVEIELSLLSPAARLDATKLASRVLETANGAG